MGPARGGHGHAATMVALSGRRQRTKLGKHKAMIGWGLVAIAFIAFLSALNATALAVDCLDLQQAITTPAALRTVQGRGALIAFYSRCGFWLLRRGLDGPIVERVATAAQTLEKSSFESASLRSFTTPDVQDPWDTAVRSLFAVVNSSLPRLMGASEVEIMKVQLMVAAGNSVDQEPHFDHTEDSKRRSPVHLMLGWVPLHQLLSDKHAPMEMWPGSHLGNQEQHLSAVSLGSSRTSTSNISVRVGPQLALGDILFMRHDLMHRGSANSEDHDRQILNIDFCAGASGQCAMHRDETHSSSDFSPSMESWGGLFTTVKCNEQK